MFVLERTVILTERDIRRSRLSENSRAISYVALSIEVIELSAPTQKQTVDEVIGRRGVPLLRKATRKGGQDRGLWRLEAGGRGNARLGVMVEEDEVRVLTANEAPKILLFGSSHSV